MKAKTLPSMTILQSAYDNIKATIGKKRAETGGILLGSREDFVIQKFVFNPSGSTTPTGYDPDIGFLNAVIKREWEINGLALLGFVHSHPRGYSRLSPDMGNNTGDLGYLKTIFQAIPALQQFWVPIVYSTFDDQEFEIFPYLAYPGNVEQYRKVPLEVIDDDSYTPPVTPSNRSDDSRPGSSNTPPRPTGLRDKSRLSGAVDTELLGNQHVVGIGVGGAQGLYENLVRSGLGKLTVLDFDRVDYSNITTQGYYLDEVGQLKVDALKARLRRINPDLQFKGLPMNFLALTETEMQIICCNADLLLLMTDDFYAQARGNRAGLHYGLPMIFAMLYERARASEVFFSVPGVTPACFRCAVSSRYHAYLQNGYQNEVGSAGSTIFDTQYLNAAIGKLALAILHRHKPGTEYSDWFGEHFARNFLQLRHHPLHSSGSEALFARTFAGNNRSFTFDALWQTIEPEVPPIYGYCCPDCGGTGDLRLAKGQIPATHLNRPVADITAASQATAPHPRSDRREQAGEKSELPPPVEPRKV